MQLETGVLVNHETVLTEGGAMALLTLNRPEQRNPLDSVTVGRLHELLNAIEADDAVGAVVITGAGPAFCAGGDMRGYQTLYYDPAAFRVFIDDVARLFERLERGPKLSVAMVNGTCLAGGFELMLACDVVTIDADAKIGDGHIRTAQLPGAGGSQRLLRTVGTKRAARLLFTGDLVRGEEAAAMGLVTAAYPATELREKTLQLVTRVLHHSPLALRRMRELVQYGQNHPLYESLRHETEVVFTYATESFDAKEGVEAFIDKRTPRYRGE
jgi:enoyl-CoA hydratase